MNPDDTELAERREYADTLTPFTALAGRTPEALHVFGRRAGTPLRAELVRTTGTKEQHEDALHAVFEGAAGSYQLRLGLEEPIRVTGAGARITLSGWQAIRYVAVGYQQGNDFVHVKAPNPPQDREFELSFDGDDLAFKVQNGFAARAVGRAHELKVFVSGTPAEEGGSVSTHEMFAWRMPTVATGPAQAPLANISALAAIYAYWSRSSPSWERQAEAYLSEGRCPINSGTTVEWPLGEARPPSMAANNTERYSWHALYPALPLLMTAREGRAPEALAAARLIAQAWSIADFARRDEHEPYTWYDHGVAERLLILVVLLAQQQSAGRDARSEHELVGLIEGHARLLASEAFYAANQRTRYHNHAWFQDIALIATAAVFPSLPGAGAWYAVARERLEDQFDKLIVRDGEYAVFVENSIGYHAGIVRLVRFAGELTSAVGDDANFAELADELDAFTGFFRYADGRAMAQGDTFRRPNPDAPVSERPVDPGLTVLPRAGYAVAKGRHDDQADGRAFVLCQVATSLNTTHKHEDNLSFGLYADGVEWLVDPSFYSHAYDDPIPSFLRSARAHNAVFVPGAAYDIAPGAASLDGYEKGSGFVTEGTSHSIEGFRYERRIEGRLDRLALDADERLIAEGDRGGDAAARLAFQIGDGVEVGHLDEAGFTLTHSASVLRLRIQLEGAAGAPVVVRNARGEDGPIGGIVGLGFMEVVPGTTLEVPLTGGALRWSLRAA